MSKVCHSPAGLLPDALLQRRDMPALTAYLGNLQQDTNVDALLLITSGQQTAGNSLIDLPSPDTLLAGRKLPFADFDFKGYAKQANENVVKGMERDLAQTQLLPAWKDALDKILAERKADLAK